MDFKEEIREYAEQPLTKQILLNVLKEYKRPHDKIDELEKQGLLVQVKRGFYVPGSKLKIPSPELFLVANHLYGPSYISSEAALSYWNRIPEKVYEISSATTNRSRIYRTAVGRFSYSRLPLPYYSFGIRKVEITKKQTVLIASPEKALCDKIVTTSNILLRSIKQTTELLIGDFRMEENELKKMEVKMMEGWLNDAPKKNSLIMLVKTLNSL